MNRFHSFLTCALLSLASAACESKLYTTGSSGNISLRPSIDPVETLFAAPGAVLSIKGKNLSPKVSLFINDEIAPLTITDSENASLTLPEGGGGDLYRLSFKIQDQTLQSFSLAKTNALGNLPVIPVGLEYICDNLIFKDQSGGIVRGGAKCGLLAKAACSSDGEIDCLANLSHPAATAADAARKIISGEIHGGIVGTAPPKPADCIADGEGGCVVDGLSFKAAKLSLYAAADIRSSVRIAGVLGSLANCSTDGEIGCRVVGPSFAAASLSGATAKILSGQFIGGIGGSAALLPGTCAADNATNCIASSAFPAVVKANVTAGLIKAGTIIAGVNGAYPSPTYPLASNSGTTDLTMFQSQLTTDGAFEFFDSAGLRYTGSGDSDLLASNIRGGTAIESLALSGIMPAVLPAPPTTLTTMYFTTPDRMILNWTSTGATGYMLVARTGAAVTFSPNRNQIYTPGVQGSNTILYVGTDLTFVHNGISSGQSYNYALYSYDANRFYSAVPTRAINTSIFCQALAGGSWVAVPGDAVYGTSDFCVQKFEAKDVASMPTSQVALSPWVNISQTASITACRSLGANYDLISNAEWLTIGTNIAAVASNWSSGTVGIGNVNRGHSDNNPSSACPASSDDTLAWLQTDCTPKNSSGDVWNQKRTHTLSNGSVVWDLSGNVWDWTSYVIPNVNAKPFGSADGAPVYAWREFTSVNSGFTAMTRGELMPTNTQKSFWNDSWTSSTYGMGQYLSDTNGSGGALIRGAYWGDGAFSGLFAAALNISPSSTSLVTGFRCSFRP